MSVESFLATVLSEGGVQSQYRWKVTINFPDGIDTDIPTRVSKLAMSTTKPTMTLGEMPLIYEGRQIPLPGDRTYEPFELTLLGVETMIAEKGFEAWQSMINNFKSNTRSGAWTDLLKTVELAMLDHEDNVIRKYQLLHAYPQIIQGSELDKGAQDSYVTLPVTIRFLNMTDPDDA